MFKLILTVLRWNEEWRDSKETQTQTLEIVKKPVNSKLYALKKKLQLSYSRFLHQRRSFMILSILKDEITKEKKYDDGSFRRMVI